jgi:hypothetical protein
VGRVERCQSQSIGSSFRVTSGVGHPVDSARRAPRQTRCQARWEAASPRDAPLPADDGFDWSTQGRRPRGGAAPPASEPATGWPSQREPQPSNQAFLKSRPGRASPSGLSHILASVPDGQRSWARAVYWLLRSSLRARQASAFLSSQPSNQAFLKSRVASPRRRSRSPNK